MAQISPSVCKICYERSTWDFLQDFYSRVASSAEHIQQLERELHEAKYITQQSRDDFTNCEASLQASWEMLNEERLNHRATREALTFEVSRHKETTELLERVFGQAVRALNVAQGLEFEIATLEAAKVIRMGHAQPMALIDAPPDGDSRPQSSSVVNQMSIPSICASSPAETKLSAEGGSKETPPHDVNQSSPQIGEVGQTRNSSAVEPTSARKGTQRRYKTLLPRQDH